MAFWWEDPRQPYSLGWQDVYDEATNDITESELEDYGLSDEALRAEFDAGFVKDDASYEERRQAREEFIAWVRELSYEFNERDFWDAWRDQYETTHG